MDTFPGDTRHRLHRLETDEDVAHVSRKFICTQLPKFVDWKRVYHFLDDDLEAIAFRAPGVMDDYADFRHIDPTEFGIIDSKQNLIRAKQVPVFEHYCEEIQPPAGKELGAFFAHGQIKKNLMDHVTHLDFPDPVAAAKRIREYQVPKALGGRELVETLGFLIRDLQVATDGVFVDQQTDEAVAPIQEEVEEDNSEEIQSGVEHVAEPEPWVEEDHWTNPVLEAFKLEAGLSTQFSSENTLKQVLVSSCARPGYLLPAKYLGKFQSTTLPSTDHLPEPLIDCAPTEVIRSICNHPALKRHFWETRLSEGRQLVKSYLEAHPQAADDEVIASLVVNAEHVL